ncbi:aromatase/cyclase [Micromonospora wenchangensis]|uniref:aromatase/cyclase n=1 Tax=Micromonospora wenchangensis TaxID=1185415 RepID=UPI003D719F51
MSDNQHTEHSITVDAPARSVYDLVADVTRWPAFFAPTVHARVLEHRDGRERIQLWAYANGEVRTWTSRRELDPDRLRVDFRQEVSTPPVAAMGGQWRMEPLDEGRTRLVLTHDYRAVDDDPAGAEWIARAVDRNSESELAGVKRIAEEHTRLDELLLTFEDEVEIAGAAPDVFDFLNRADEWPERLPHVDRLELREDVPGIQHMVMDTRTADGSVHTTTSVRVCFSPTGIVYKQTQVPKLMTAHTGEWRLDEGTDGVRLTSRHTVLLKPSAIDGVLGAEATIADARSYVRTALGRNSLATMGLAKRYAEALTRG